MVQGFQQLKRQGLDSWHVGCHRGRWEASQVDHGLPLAKEICTNEVLPALEQLGAMTKATYGSLSWASSLRTMLQIM